MGEEWAEEDPRGDPWNRQSSHVDGTKFVHKVEILLRDPYLLTLMLVHLVNDRGASGRVPPRCPVNNRSVGKPSRKHRWQTQRERRLGLRPANVTSDVLSINEIKVLGRLRYHLAIRGVAGSTFRRRFLGQLAEQGQYFSPQKPRASGHLSGRVTRPGESQNHIPQATPHELRLFIEGARVVGQSPGHQRNCCATDPAILDGQPTGYGPNPPALLGA